MSDEKRVLAAHNGLGYVFECACGTIHLVLGPMDLRITRERLLDIYQMLGEAIAQLPPLASEETQIEGLAIDGSKLRTN